MTFVVRILSDIWSLFMPRIVSSSTRHLSTPHASMSDTDLVEHVLSRLCWVSRDDFLDHVSTHCVDGRGGCAIVGAPGGDAGEFMLTLAAVEKITGHLIPESAIKTLFEEYRAYFGHFYMHTDSHMLEQLADDLEKDVDLGGLVKGLPHEQIVSELENVIRMPPTKLRAKLLERLIAIVKLGCGHLALMRQHADEYGVRKELVNAFLKAFYEALWNGDRVEWEVLKGEHAERAVVNIIAETGEDIPSEMPLVAPHCHGEQVFVNHPQGEKLILDKSYEFVKKHFGVMYEIDAEKYKNVVSELLNLHTMATLGYLAKGLPIFEAHVTPMGDCAVVKVGVV